MSCTGHNEFDRCKDKFSVIIRDMESTLHNRFTESNSTDNEDGRSLPRLIRSASSVLSNMSSMAKNVSETDEPALKQELLDIYKACKMQLKTYKLLHAQTDLFQTTVASSPIHVEKTASDREILFGARSGVTTDDSSENDKTASSRTKSLRDEITSNTQGRLREQNSRLKDALRSLRETDQVAQEISGELAGQRDMLQTTKGRLDQFSSMTEYSKNLLNSMNKPWWRKW